MLFQRLALALAVLASFAARAADAPVIGLITKTESNPLQTAMENCLQKDPNINLIYTGNEPAAAGAFNALRKAGAERGVTIVSIDGGCEGVCNVASGMIAATSQQYPVKMGAMDVAAAVEYTKTGKKPSGYINTGVTLIAHKPVAGVDSKDVKSGTDLGQRVT